MKNRRGGGVFFFSKTLKSASFKKKNALTREFRLKTEKKYEGAKMAKKNPRGDVTQTEIIFCYFGPLGFFLLFLA